MTYFVYPDIFKPMIQRAEEYLFYRPLESTCLSITDKTENLDDGSVKRIVVPYIGSLERDVPEGWLEKIDSHFIKFHMENEIPAVFSVYPTNLDGNIQLDMVLKKIYLSDCFELMQKGTDNPDTDPMLYKMPFALQKKEIHDGKKNLEDKLKSLLPNYDISPIASFNSLGGRVNNDTIRALDELGYKIYFELFLEEGVEILKEPHSDFDVYQYGLRFTRDEIHGPGNRFKSKEEIIMEVVGPEIEDDPRVKKFKNITIVPLFLENWDIEAADASNPEGNGEVNTTKWGIYKNTLLELDSRGDVIILHPAQIWTLRHGTDNIPPRS